MLAALAVQALVSVMSLLNHWFYDPEGPLPEEDPTADPTSAP